MTAAAVIERELAPGDIVPVPSRSVCCSRCEEPTDQPVFMGLTTVNKVRLPLWWCLRCKARFEATS